MLKIPVAASLLMKAACQPIIFKLKKSFREQARSHRVWGSIRFFNLSRAMPTPYKTAITFKNKRLYP
ncbi:hypothetical protein BK675_16905 [Pseudomonas fluorescens]|nr:hypothetical protein BK677_09780 [Pseudomonas fluorescens]ROO06193.1 hypothetical protein BK675_16905 [Pseudomonas fluorescens]ROO16082.1 hypothetical protein BK676_18285 [Pseudomonas fluorescens]